MAISGMGLFVIVLVIILVVVPLCILTWFWYTAANIADSITEIPGGKCKHGDKTIDCKDMITTMTYVKAFVPCTFGILILICVIYMAQSPAPLAESSTKLETKV